MRPNLDPAISAELPKPLIRPALLLQIALNSGTEYVWSGVGDLVWDGHTFKGLGMFASMGAITEASEVQAEGTTVTLSGIGLSDVPFPPLGVTPPSPPRATVAGESMAWTLAKTYGPASSTFSIPPGIFNGFLGVSGGGNVTQTTGSVAIVGGDSLDVPHIGGAWSDFPMPLEVPAGALITGVYAVATGVSINQAFADFVLNGTTHLWDGSPIDVHTLAGLNAGIIAYSTLPGTTGPSVAVGFIGAAVYYMGTPLTGPRMLYEALADVRLGAPAKIWFALVDVNSPALVGMPYRIFAGVVDKPSVKISPDGSSITLALENRLINLQRANNRKYTAADQHIAFPNDLGFNWVEILQEISLKEGS